jgi:octaprenyl-diphosphate synthase
VLLAFARGDAEEKAFWRRTIEERDQDQSDLPTAIALMQKHRAFADTVARARDYGAKALAALAPFADSAEKRALADIVGFCISRAR